MVLVPKNALLVGVNIRHTLVFFQSGAGGVQKDKIYQNEFAKVAENAGHGNHFLCPFQGGPHSTKAEQTSTCSCETNRFWGSCFYVEQLPPALWHT